jgi:hypothetical protein
MVLVRPVASPELPTDLLEAPCRAIYFSQALAANKLI